jgi:hypothetical protein
MAHLPSWKDIRAEFQKYADYADHAERESPAEWEQLPQGPWTLRVGSPRSQRIFKEIAAKAADKRGLASHTDDAEPWQLWLDLVWAQGWRRPDAGKSSRAATRPERVSWREAKRILEEEGRIQKIERIFQTSADCCAEFEEHEMDESEALVSEAGVTNRNVAGKSSGKPKLDDQLGEDRFPEGDASSLTRTKSEAAGKDSAQGDDGDVIAAQQGDVEMVALGAAHRSNNEREVENTVLKKRWSEARDAQKARAQTVARIIRELDLLRPQMFEDESQYERLRVKYPDFLTFCVAEQRPDLKQKVLSIRASVRHIRLAQELAGGHHGRQLSTIQEDWKNFKPAEFKRSS